MGQPKKNYGAARYLYKKSELFRSYCLVIANKMDTLKDTAEAMALLKKEEPIGLIGATASREITFAAGKLRWTYHIAANKIGSLEAALELSYCSNIAMDRLKAP